MANKEGFVEVCGGIQPERPELTELVFILDRSGSMSGLEQDTIGGFNAMIEKQKKEEGLALVSTVLFANDSKVLHDRVEVREVAPLTEKDYVVGGCTALLDAIGGAIHHIGNVHKYARPEDIVACLLQGHPDGADAGWRLCRFHRRRSESGPSSAADERYPTEHPENAESPESGTDPQ